ncbi:MAG: HD domain-containing protein [Bdellovibrionaceae bacterium]|nr:HD domain-containing protein [Pseudobdellovibrionaceae bacterium]
MSSESDIPSWSVDAINAVLQTLKLKDPFTFYHCCRVGRASRRLAKAMSLSEHEQNILEFSGLLHDVGKVGIADKILLKPDRLTDEEMTKMKSHAEMSCEIIQPLLQIPFFRFLLPGIRYHHEQFDGSGYPNQLSGEKIPLMARIIAVVDTVDAMTNTRPYRQSLSIERTHKELIDFSGRQFDGNIVKTYLEAQKHWKGIEEVDKEERVVPSVVSAIALKKAS